MNSSWQPFLLFPLVPSLSLQRLTIACPLIINTKKLEKKNPQSNYQVEISSDIHSAIDSDEHEVIASTEISKHKKKKRKSYITLGIEIKMYYSVMEVVMILVCQCQP